MIPRRIFQDQKLELGTDVGRSLDGGADSTLIAQEPKKIRPAREEGEQTVIESAETLRHIATKMWAEIDAGQIKRPPGSNKGLIDSETLGGLDCLRRNTHALGPPQQCTYTLASVDLPNQSTPS